MTKKVAVLLADGFEEIELVAPVDILRRAGVEVTLISVGKTVEVKGGHGLVVVADALLDDTNVDLADMLLLPGGPGTKGLNSHDKVRGLVKEFAEKEKWIASICAAPMIPGELGLLQGHQATCYPGYEIHLKGARHSTKEVVVSAPFITACGAGVALNFGFELVACLKDATTASNLAKKMMAHY